MTTTAARPDTARPDTAHVYLSDLISRRELTLTLGGILLCLFLASLNQSIVNTAIPRIVSDLNGFEIYAWVTTAFMLTSTAVVPIVGKLGDMFGRKRLLISGTIYFLITTALCGLAQDMGQLIALRGFQGIGGGVLTATSFAIVAELLAPVDRARIGGLFTGTFSLSTIVGPLVGGYLTDTFSWRAVFFVTVPVGLVSLAILWRAFPEVPHTRKSLPMDFGGAATLILSSVLLLLALTWGGRQLAWTSPQILALFGTSAMLLALFVWIEAHAIDPVLPLTMFRNNVVTISVVGAAAQSIGVFGASLFIPLFVQGVVGTSATVSGSVMAPMMLTMLASSIGSGQLIARMGRTKPFTICGFALTALSMYLLSRLGPDADYGSIVFNMILLGLGSGLVGPTVTLAAQNASRPSELGVVTSLLQFSRQMGNTLGTAAFGAILTLTFLPETQAAVPPVVRGRLDDSALAAIRDPQALLSPEAAQVLRLSIVERLPDTPEAVELVFLAIRTGLAGSLHWIFLSAALVSVAALVLTLFVHEIPLRGRGRRPDPVEARLTPIAKPV